MERHNGSSSRTQLVLMLTVALLSLGGAYLLFYLTQGGAPWGTTNQGTLVQPPVTVSELAVQTDAGAAMDTEGLWWLWVVPAGRCEAECREALHLLRQLHVLLNKDATRVRRALVLTDGPAAPAPAQVAEILEEYPQLGLLSGPETLQRGIYVVDPLGNLVFHYPLTDAGAPVLDDLKRLLKLSQIG